MSLLKTYLEKIQVINEEDNKKMTEQQARNSLNAINDAFEQGKFTEIEEWEPYAIYSDSNKQNLCVEFRNEKNKREWISGLADCNASYAPYLSDLKFCGYRNQEFPLELFKF